MSARILSVEIGYEGPGGPIMPPALLLEIPDGVNTLDALDEAIAEAKANFKKEYGE